MICGDPWSFVMISDDSSRVIMIRGRVFKPQIGLQITTSCPVDPRTHSSFLKSQIFWSTWHGQFHVCHWNLLKSRLPRKCQIIVQYIDIGKHRNISENIGQVCSPREICSTCIVTLENHQNLMDNGRLSNVARDSCNLKARLLIAKVFLNRFFGQLNKMFKNGSLGQNKNRHLMIMLCCEASWSSLLGLRAFASHNDLCETCHMTFMWIFPWIWPWVLCQISRTPPKCSKF